MSWTVVYSEEFESWITTLSRALQLRIEAAVELLEEDGPVLSFPLTSAVRGSRHGSRMRELRIQYHGLPYRVLYAFDAHRTAVLLVGGRKTGSRWYERFVRRADDMFESHESGLK